MNQKFTSRRTGFTLIELLVVVAILAILAGLIIARMSGVTDRAQAGVAASNTSDVIRMIETYRVMHGAYADGWDTLVTATGGTPGTTLISSANPVLQLMLAAPSVISTEHASSMKLAGINHINYHDDAFTGPPSDSGQVSTHFTPHGGGPPTVSVVKLLVTSPTAYGGTDGSPAYYMLANQFNLPSYFSGGTDTSYIAQNDFIVMGLGPKNWTVSETMMSAPIFDVHDVGRYYSRALAIFAVPKAATGMEKAQFIGVMGPDGKGVAGYLADYYKQAPRDH